MFSTFVPLGKNDINVLFQQVLKLSSKSMHIWNKVDIRFETEYRDIPKRIIVPLKFQYLLRLILPDKTLHSLGYMLFIFSAIYDLKEYV